MQNNKNIAAVLRVVVEQIGRPLIFTHSFANAKF